MSECPGKAEVGEEFTSVGLCQQDTRARFVDSTTVLHDSASGNAQVMAKNLVQDLIARGLKSTVRAGGLRARGATGPGDCYLGGVQEQAARISGQLQADPAEAPVSKSAIVLAGRCEVLHFRLGDSTYSQSCVAAAGFDTRFKVLEARALPLSQDIPASSYRVDASPGGLAKPPSAMLTSSRPEPADSRYNMLTGDGKHGRDMRHYEFKIDGTNGH